MRCQRAGWLLIHPRKLTWNLKMMVFIGISCSRGSFSGSMLVFGGVIAIVRMLKNLPSGGVVCYQGLLLMVAASHRTHHHGYSNHHQQSPPPPPAITITIIITSNHDHHHHEQFKTEQTQTITQSKKYLPKNPEGCSCFFSAMSSMYEILQVIHHSF